MKGLLIVTFSLFLSGCAILSSDTGSFAVQYGTIKLIEESETVSAEGVLDATTKVRDIVEDDSEVSLSSLTSSFRERVDISSLPKADQLLVNAIIARVQSTVSEQFDSDSSIFRIEQKTNILQLLDAIDEAALLYD